MKKKNGKPMRRHLGLGLGKASSILLDREVH
jgi:hypothetical protein